MTEGVTSREAVEEIVDYFGITSYYGIAKALSDETLTVQPIQISNYCKNTKMSKKVAQRVFDTFGIIVTDAFDNSKFR